MGYKDLLVEAYEFSALLRHDTTYELIEFLTRVHVTTMTRIAEQHADNQMIQRALAGELEVEEDRALQKIERKKHHKSNNLLIHLPILNTTLVEAFRELDHTTCTAKKMTRCSKMARKQEKTT